jgi:hypothetical protein
MKDKRIEQLKKDYMNIPIPNELDFVVRKALKSGGVKISQKGNISKKFIKVVATTAASIVMLAAMVNISPAFAKAVSEVPIVGGVVKVLTFREYTVNEDTFKAEIEVPAISGLENKDLENSLNEKYLEEDKQFYEQFNADKEQIKESNGGPGGHLGVESGYVVKTDNDRILSMGRYVVNTVGSSSTVFKYETIDKKNQTVITLPSLFKDDSYIDVISENIKNQMIEQNKADKNKFYWVAGIEQKGNITLFENISKEQSFYINSEGKLVISFDKYEVAPGYMGIVEFVIPTDILSDILVSNEYIK